MTYEEFQGSVIGTLAKRFPKDTSIQIHKVIKTNDRELDGIVISEPNSQISPTIYLNPFFEAFERGASSFDEIIDTIFKAYDHHRNTETFDTEDFIRFERARDKIVFRLINREKNEKLLSDVPFMPYLDLAVTFSFLVDLKGEGLGAILIHNAHMEEWGKKKEELYEAAASNVKRLLPPALTPMNEIMKSVGIIDQNELDAYEKSPLYVLTNEKRNYGAATILYKDELMKAAKKLKTDRLCIIPSSVHEVLLMPEEIARCREDIDEMVREVNSATVPPDEVLSDHAYYYDASKDSITF